MDRVKAPFQVPLFLDSNWVDVWPQEGNRTRDPEWPPYTTPGSGSMNQLCHTRHSKMTNIVFMDGSSRRTALKDLWGLKWHKNYQTTNAVTRGEVLLPTWMQ